MSRRRSAAFGPALAAGLLAAACAGAPAPPPAAPAHEVVGSGGQTTGPLRLTRAELSFADGVAGATVARGAPLGAAAVLRFDGSGLFRGVWEADGRALAEVSFPVTYGNTVRVRTPSWVTLPTLDPGPHRLVLRVVEPLPTFEVPPLSYFVISETPRGRP